MFVYYLAKVWSELKFRVPKVAKNSSTLGTFLACPSWSIIRIIKYVFLFVFRIFLNGSGIYILFAKDCNLIRSI